MRGDDASFPQRTVQQLKVRLLEECLRGAIGVGAVRDDHVELVLAVAQELEAIADVDLDLGVLVADGHFGEILFGEPDHGFVDVAEDGRFYGRVLDDFPENSSVAAPDDEDFLGGGVGIHG